MIIHISKSVLFTTDPDTRFASEYHVPRGLWNLIYSRYKYLDLSRTELCDLTSAKMGRKMLDETVKRWLWRTEVYKRALPFIKRGDDTVVSQIFGDMEMEVIAELTKNLKRSVGMDVKSLP